MKVLVTNTAGCVGSALVSGLLSAGHELLGFGECDLGAQTGLTQRSWPTRSDVFARALAGVDVVFALDLAEIDADSAQATERRLQKLVAAVVKAEGPQIVLLSRTDVYDPEVLRTGTARETSQLCAPGSATAEVNAALVVEKDLQERGVNRWSILRAPVLLAPQGRHAKDLFRAILIDGAHAPARFHGVDAVDVAKALMVLATAPRVAGQVFNIAAPQTLSGTVMDQELGRLARLLSDESEADDAVRPAYEVAEPVLATDKLARLTGVSAVKPVWTSLAETVQQLMKDLRADGTLDPLPEKINPIVKAVETGVKPLAGQVALITDCTSTMGRATSVLLSRLGATVVGAGRDATLGHQLMAELEQGRHTCPGHFFEADLMSLAQIRKLAAQVCAQFARIDIMINTADSRFATRRVTEDGYEETFALNHLAPFLLTNLLAVPLKAADAARIIMVSSDAHVGAQPDLLDLQMVGGFSAEEAYGRAKFLNLQIAYVMAVLLEETHVTVNAISPGTVRISEDIEPAKRSAGSAKTPDPRADPRMISPEAAAIVVASLAASDEFQGKTGLYLDRGEVKQSDPATYDEDMAWHIWELTARLTGLSQNDQAATGG